MDIQGLPEQLPEDIEQNEKALQALHKLLMEIVIEDGNLECTSCTRLYPIKQGIPNMVLREDEVKIKK